MAASLPIRQITHSGASQALEFQPHPLLPVRNARPWLPPDSPTLDG